MEYVNYLVLTYTAYKPIYYIFCTDCHVIMCYRCFMVISFYMKVYFNLSLWLRICTLFNDAVSTENIRALKVRFQLSGRICLL
jgi:hypothetical protein